MYVLFVEQTRVIVICIVRLEKEKNKMTFVTRVKHRRQISIILFPVGHQLLTGFIFQAEVNAFEQGSSSKSKVND